MLSAALVAAAMVGQPLALSPGRPGDILAAFHYFCAGSGADFDEAAKRFTALHWTTARVPPLAHDDGIRRKAGFRSPNGDMEAALTEGVIRSPKFSGPVRQCALISKRPPPEPLVPEVQKWIGQPPEDSKPQMVVWNVPARIVAVAGGRLSKVLAGTLPNGSSALTLMVPN